MPSRPRQAGFTLIEVLVALAVFGFLMLGLSQGIGFGLKAWGMQARAIAAQGDMDAVDRTLRGLIARTDPNIENEPSFVGDAGRLSWITVLPIAADGLGTRRAQAVLFVDGAHRLILRTAPRPHARSLGTPPAASETVLLTGVAGLTLAYGQSAAEGGGWVASWTGEDGPPELVRLHIAFTDRARRWPDILAAPSRDRPDA